MIVLVIVISHVSEQKIQVVTMMVASSRLMLTHRGSPKGCQPARSELTQRGVFTMELILRSYADPNVVANHLTRGWMKNLKNLVFVLFCCCFVLFCFVCLL